MFFMNYDVRFRSTEQGPKGITRQWAASLACSIAGLTGRETAAYLGVAPRTPGRTLDTLYDQLCIRRPQREGTGPHALRALSLLARLGVVELGQPTALTDGHNANILQFAEELLQGNSASEIGKKYDLTERAVRAQMIYWRNKAGFDTNNAYILHLLAAGAIGEITYKPRLVEELPALSLEPPNR